MDAIEKLTAKVDDHDRSITLISKTMEDINKNLERFAESNEKLNHDMTKHWHSQDLLMQRMETILERLSNYDAKFQVIDDRQHNGCPSLKSHLDKRESELRNWEFRATSLETAAKKCREEIVQLQGNMGVVVEKIAVANNRIKDLEEDKKKGMWLLLTAFIGIAASFVQGALE